MVRFVQKALFNQRIGRRNVSLFFKDLQELRSFTLDEISIYQVATLCAGT